MSKLTDEYRVEIWFLIFVVTFIFMIFLFVYGESKVSAMNQSRRIETLYELCIELRDAELQAVGGSTSIKTMDCLSNL